MAAVVTNVMPVLCVISSVTVRGEARERWGADAGGNSSRRSKPSTTLAPSVTSFLQQGPRAFGALLGTLGFWLVGKQRWEATVLLVVLTHGKLGSSMNFTSDCHKLRKRRGLLCVRYCGCSFLSPLHQPSSRGGAWPISSGHSPFYYIPHRVLLQEPATLP